ncbi:hypothetical protein LFZ50_16780 [Salmonella enterica subsp. arizonae serovar 53:-:- str. SA20100345]|nr:hypothetical protein LFZ50_16780 [Salmonella enterica subsp. arizonae serovar 53:-:- str. SA20100345]ECX9456396.1 hypothetical protein [Salmonella enterica]EDA0834311.1 hypothetical protein [Salmonella enterica]
MTRLAQDSYLRNKELVALNSGKQTTVGSGVFFLFTALKTTRGKKGSQEDPFFRYIYRLFH